MTMQIVNQSSANAIGVLASGAPLTMSSREISELTGKEHAHVMRDIRAMMDVLSTNPDLDSCAISATYTGKDGRQYPMYELDKDTCLTLLLGYDAAARMRVVKRWQELEAGAVPNTFAGALRLAAEQAALALAAPKVAFVDKYATANGNKGFRQVCKLLRANESRFREFLTNKAIMYRLGGEWVPHSQHIDAGRFEVKAGRAWLYRYRPGRRTRELRNLCVESATCTFTKVPREVP